MDSFKTVGSEKDDKISQIMAKCFNDLLDTVNFFLENKPKSSKCYICENEAEIISLLHAIPYKINIEKKYFNCLYIYGACTKPKYRQQGYMSKLIKFCEAESKMNGIDFLALVPENKHLENYYNRLGYKNFFKIKEINLSKEELLKFCNLSDKKSSPKNENNDTYGRKNYKNIENLRLSIYNDISGVMYRAEDIEYAAKLYEFFGGKLISSEYGHAICVPEAIDTLEIKDFTCKREFIPDLLQKIYINFPDFKNFKIKTYSNDDFFKENCTDYFYGMIKALSYSGEKALESFYLNGRNSAYLGLALD